MRRRPFRRSEGSDRPVRRITKIKAVLCVAVAAGLAAGVASHAELGSGSGSQLAAREAPAGLRGHGHASGFYPGRHRPVWVQVRNPFGHRARVRWIRTSVGDASAGCSGGNLVAQRSRGLRQLASGKWHHVRIPARQWRRVRVRTRLRSRAPDACQGATFPLRFLIKVKIWQRR